LVWNTNIQVEACGIKSALCIPLDIPGNSAGLYIHVQAERTYSGGLVAVLIKPTEMDRNIRVLIDTAAYISVLRVVPLVPEKKKQFQISTAAMKINLFHGNANVTLARKRYCPENSFDFL